MLDKSQYYDSQKSRRKAREELIQIFNYRDLVYQLVRRDVLSRYKRSTLGVAWTMLNPLGMMLVLTIAFSQLFNTVDAYPVYVLSGLIAWNFFVQTTMSAMDQMVWGGALLSRIYLPRTVFAVSSIGTGLVNLVLSFIPLAIVMIFIGQPIQVSVLFLPISIALLACFSLGMGLLFSSIAVYYPDVVQMYQIGLSAWFYLTPIIYPPEIIPESIRNWILLLNPMYHLITMFREPIYQGTVPGFYQTIVASLISFVMLIIGWVIFTGRSDEFAYKV